MIDAELLQPCCDSCRHRPSTPCVHAIECIENGLMCHEDAGCTELRAIRLAVARRGGKGTLIFLGLGTCGLGIEPANLARLGDEFFRERRKETKNIEGNGLGLAIVKRLINRAGGRLQISSTLGTGSEFRPIFPC